MRGDLFKGAVLGAAVASIVTLAGGALAGTGVGAVFNLGVTNAAGKVTTLVGTSSKTLQITNRSGSSSAVAVGASSKGAGAPALRASNTGGGPALGLSVKPGAAPFTVNSSAMVAKLNAALLDGNSASAFQRSYSHTVVVSPGATPSESGTALLDGLAGITTASSNNPFLVKLEPGVYDVGATAVSMQPYVDVEGSGQDTTTITGTQSFQTIHPQSNSELRDVTVENTGGGAAILANIGSPVLTHVTALSSTSDGTKNIYGIEDVNCSPIMTDVAASASTDATAGSGSRYGVYDSNSSPTMIDVAASATGGSGSGADSGVENVSGSAPVMDLVQASASGAGSDFGVENHASSPLMAFDTATATASGTLSLQAGVYNTAGASPMMDNIVATASGGTYINIGVWNEVSSMTLNQVDAVASGGGSNNRGIEDSAGGGSYTVKINNSEITGSSATIDNTSASFTTDIGGSLLNGGAVSTGGGTVTCVDSYSGTYTALNSSCT